MKKQMTLEEFKKRAENYLLKIPNDYTFYRQRIEEEAEDFWADSWEPEVMVQAMTSGLV